MKNYWLLYISILLFSTCQFSKTNVSEADEKVFEEYLVDVRDGNKYGIVRVADQKWMAENLRYDSPKSICYKKKTKNCLRQGKLYPYDELEIICPQAWRVPNVHDWQELKSTFGQDSIYALLNTENWSNTQQHTNDSGLALEGVGYQMERKLFIGAGFGTTLWLNQMNKFEEYYHAHIYGGKGINFEKTNYRTNEVLHAHPIDDLENRRFSVRCICEK